MQKWDVIVGDCLEVMRTLDANSVDAVVTDPPYFKVKNEHWDRQWDSPKVFLAWLDEVAEQWQRVLKPNGSLYCFASWRMASRVECLLEKRFNILSNIVWQKAAKNGGGWHTRQHKQDLRAWFPQTERIIFAEHYGADNIAKGEAGYAAKCDELRGFVFEPLRKYLADEFAALGWNADKLNEICGTAEMAGRHYALRSQWCLPTAEHYAKLQASANGHLRREYEDLRREYEDLRREYEDLRREYEDLRRPFTVSSDIPYTDVWTFPTVQAYKGKHPCEKPLAMMEHIVKASTRPGSVVLDCFAGSGVVGVACLNLGRSFVGIERETKYAAIARARIAAAQPEASLFGASDG